MENTITISIAEYSAMVKELAKYHVIEALRKTGKSFLDDAVKEVLAAEPEPPAPVYQTVEYQKSDATDSSTSGILE